MKKIIHLSDAHVGSGQLAHPFRDIVTTLIFTKQPAENYVVIITGDLVDDATAAGTLEEASSQVQRLQDAGYAVLLAPGNHDYGTGSLGVPDCRRRFKHHFFGDPEALFPRVDLIGDVAFIALDSMEEELHWHDALFAEGELGDSQLGLLAQRLQESEVQQAAHRVVYLHHHPFHPKPFHRLKDSDKLAEVLSGQAIDALLFGHNHDGRKWNGVWGIPRVYDAGSATGKKGGTICHRVIDLSRDPVFDYDAEFY